MKFSTNIFQIWLAKFKSLQLWLVGCALLFLAVAIWEGILVFQNHLNIERYSNLIYLEEESLGQISHLKTDHYYLSELLHTYASFDNTLLAPQIEQINNNLEKLELHFQRSTTDSNTKEKFDEYKAEWQTFQEQLSQLLADPLSNPNQDSLHLELAEINSGVNELAEGSQQKIATYLANINQSLQFLNKLLPNIYLAFTLSALLMGASFWRFVREGKKSKEALSLSEQRQRALLEAIPDGVIRRNRGGYYTYFKPGKTFSHFMPATNFIGKHISELVPPEIAKMNLDATERAFVTGEEQVFEYQSVAQQTGKLRDLEARVLPINNDEVQLIVRDMTEEKQRERQAQEAQKLESLGMLAGGIAHDFNNLLTGMLTQLSLAKSKLELGLSPADQINKAENSAGYAAELVRQLLAYAGKGKNQTTVLDLNRLIQETSGLLDAALLNNAQLQLILAENMPAIEGDRAQLQQVIMNLVINAAEALKETGGHVEIITALQEIVEDQTPNGYIGEILKPGVYLGLQVCDNGNGIEQQVITQIFEPYFSTKEKGHGLGLSAALGIIRNHHGAIRVESSVGVGTTFSILFPTVALPAGSPVTSQAIAAATPLVDTIQPQQPSMLAAPSKSSILLIDDEPAIQEAIADILFWEEIPFLVATSGQAGIEQFRQHHQQIGLVLLDMKMPGMGGKETFALLHEIDPNVKVVLSSGYSETEIDSDFPKSNMLAFLPKPYRTKQLVELIHQALR